MVAGAGEKNTQLVLLHVKVGCKNLSGVDEYTDGLQKVLDREFKVEGYKIKYFMSLDYNTEAIDVQCIYPQYIAKENMPDVPSPELLAHLIKEINL